MKDRNTPTPPSPEELLRNVMDGIQQMAEMFGGQKAALVARGYTEREAAALVVANVSLAAASEWKEVMKPWTA